MTRRSNDTDLYYDSEGNLISEVIGRQDPFLQEIALCAPEQRLEIMSLRVFQLFSDMSDVHSMQDFIERKLIPATILEGKAEKEWKEITWLGLARSAVKSSGFSFKADPTEQRDAESSQIPLQTP